MQMLYNASMEVEVLPKLTTLDTTSLESITSILELTLDEAELLLELITTHYGKNHYFDNQSEDQGLSSCLKLRDVLNRSMNMKNHRSQEVQETWPP